MRFSVLPYSWDKLTFFRTKEQYSCRGRYVCNWVVVLPLPLWKVWYRSNTLFQSYPLLSTLYSTNLSSPFLITTSIGPDANSSKLLKITNKRCKYICNLYIILIKLVFTNNQQCLNCYLTWLFRIKLIIHHYHPLANLGSILLRFNFPCFNICSYYPSLTNLLSSYLGYGTLKGLN